MQKKKCLQNNLNRASERNVDTFLTIPNRASSPQTSELWASCAVHTFILLTSAVLNGNNLVWRVRPGMSDFRKISEFRASAQLGETPRSSLSHSPQSASVSGLMVETLGSVPESNLCETPIEESKVTEVARVGRKIFLLILKRASGRLLLQYRKTSRCYF